MLDNAGVNGLKRIKKDRDWAQNQIRHAKNSFLLALASIDLFKNNSSALEGRSVLLRRDQLIFNPLPSDFVGFGVKYHFAFDQIIYDSIHKPDDLSSSLREIWKSARRRLVVESFEVCKAYAKANKKFELFKKQSWFMFFLTIRNALGHDLHFDIKDTDFKFFPTAWNGKEIFLTMNKTPMAENFIDPAMAIEIVIELLKFIEAD